MEGIAGGRPDFLGRFQTTVATAKGIKMKEVFIGRKVHDQLLEHSPGLIEEIFEREPEPIWQLGGVSVRMTPALYDSFTRSTKELKCNE